MLTWLHLSYMFNSVSYFSPPTHTKGKTVFQLLIALMKRKEVRTLLLTSFGHFSNKPFLTNRMKQTKKVQTKPN